MPATSNFAYDVAVALSIGQRDSQEDAVLADFPQGHDVGFCVLADGMGGHASGDVASKIVVTEVFSELKLQSGDAERLEGNITRVLTEAARSANTCVRLHSDAHPDSFGMGATLVAPVLVRDRLYWVSVGDSPLYLYRDGRLIRLNEDHSLGSQIDMLVERGLMPADAAADHPDRHCLTSVLIGQTISRIDCTGRPVTLQPGDIVVVASDGLQFLDTTEIEDLIHELRDRPSAEIAVGLIRALDALDDPEQDNTSVCIIRFKGADAAAAPEDHQPEPEIVAAIGPRPDPAPAARPIPEPEVIAASGQMPPETAHELSPGTTERITMLTRQTRRGLSMLYHIRRKAAKTA